MIATDSPSGHAAVAEIVACAQASLIVTSNKPFGRVLAAATEEP
jgi:hypothetical protein